MKALTTFVLVLLFGAVSARSQQTVSRYDNIAFGTLPGGNVLQALPNAMISVQGCASMSTSCTLPANLCSGITDASCGLPGVLYADSGGNFHFYARAGRYQVTISAAGYQPRTINDVILPISASDGAGVGTSVTVNGTAAVPNQLNFTNTLLPPSGSTVVNFLLNGNTVGAYVTGGGGGGGGGTPFTVNGVAPAGIVNFNASSPGPPPNGINVNWSLVGTGLTAAIVGDGNPNSCLIGTGIFAACPGGSGGGGGTPLPTIPQYNLYASNGSGGAQDSGTKAGLPGFLETEVLLATGDVTSQAAPFQLFPNASVEYFPTGYAWSGGTAGAAHGFAGYFSHSSGTTASANGGIGLGGGNSSGSGNQIYLDCEIAGCDFKVPLTVNGAGVGGGGGGSGTVASGALGHFTWYAAAGTTVSSNANLDDSVSTPATITSQETLAAPGINVTGSGGISMTGTGGSLPTPAANSGGIGIGPGNVPQYYSNGGAWTAIGSGGTGGGITGATLNGGLVVSGTTLGMQTNCSAGQVLQWNSPAWGCATVGTGGGGSGTVGTGTAGQHAVYNGANSIVGSTNLSESGSVLTLAPTAIISGIGSASLTPVASTGAFGIYNGGGNGNWPAISPNGAAFTLVPIVQINGTVPNLLAGPYRNFQSTCTSVANGYCITVQALASGGLGFSLVGDGSANCLSGTGTYVNCGGAGGGTTVQVNGVAVGSTANFNASTTAPPVPTNGRIITFNNAGAGSASITAALVGDGSANCLSGTGTYVNCGAGGGGSGTVSPNNGTVGALAYYAAAGGSTTVAPMQIAAATTGTNGINIGTGLLQFGSSNTATDLNIGRYSSGVLTISTGTSNTSEGGYLRSSNSCAVTTAVQFTSSGLASTVCQRSLVSNKAWIVHCVIPWDFTTGTGTSAVNIGITLAQTPVSLTNFTTVLWGSAGPVFGTTQVSAFGNTNLITTTALDVTDHRMYSAFLDGVVAQNATNTGNISITASTAATSVTAQIEPGAYCRFE